jgi:hypothetical protein
LALPFVRQNLRPFLSTPNHDDLATLQQMMESGTVTTVIDRTDLLSETRRQSTMSAKDTLAEKSSSPRESAGSVRSLPGAALPTAQVE